MVEYFFGGNYLSHVLYYYNNTIGWYNAMKFHIDPASGVPFYRQIIDQIKYAIAREELKQGDQLPTVRQLSSVGVSVNS